MRLDEIISPDHFGPQQQQQQRRIRMESTNGEYYTQHHCSVCVYLVETIASLLHTAQWMNDVARIVLLLLLHASCCWNFYFIFFLPFAFPVDLHLRKFARRRWQETPGPHGRPNQRENERTAIKWNNFIYPFSSTCCVCVQRRLRRLGCDSVFLTSSPYSPIE